MELGELHRTIHGRTAEREVASGEMYRKTRKHGSDAMSQNVRSGSPRAGPSPGASLAMRRPGRGSSLPDPGAPRAGHAHTRRRGPVRLPATARPRPAPAPRRGTTRTPPRRGRAARAAPPLTQNNTTNQLNGCPHSTLHRQSALLQTHKSLTSAGETDRVTLPGPAGIDARHPGQRLARGPPCRRPHR